MPSSAITSQICSRSSGSPLRRAVLQRDLALAGDEIGDLGRQRVHRQRGEVGHAARERDHLRPARHREQRPDLRRRHPRRTRREPLGGGRRTWDEVLRHVFSSVVWVTEIRSSVIRMEERPALRRDIAAGHSSRGGNRGWIDLSSGLSTRTAAATPTRPTAIGRRRSCSLSWHMAPLTLDNLDNLPKRCRRCVFWELSEQPRQAGGRLRLHGAGEGGVGLRGAARVGLVRPGRAHGRRACRIRHLRAALGGAARGRDAHRAGQRRRRAAHHHAGDARVRGRGPRAGCSRRPS